MPWFPGFPAVTNSECTAVVGAAAGQRCWLLLSLLPVGQQSFGMGVLEQKTRILEHSWQPVALVLLQSPGLLCCIHLKQSAAGVNPSGCSGGSRVGNAGGWEGSHLCCSCRRQLPQLRRGAHPSQTPTCFCSPKYPVSREMTVGFSCSPLVLPHPAEARVNHSCVGTALGAGLSLREALQSRQ